MSDGTLSPLERVLSRVSPVRAGEGAAVVVLFSKNFLLLFAYYLLKPAREALVLTEGSAEVRSYALAAQALSLMAIIPVYTAFLRKIFPHYHIVPWITAFLAANLAVFLGCGLADIHIGVVFFIWIGIFNVLIVTQFWAFAADLFSVDAGQRLFVLIAIGASAGAWVGAIASKTLFAAFGLWGTMAIGLAVLLLTIPFTPLARRLVPADARPPVALQIERPDEIRGLLAGFRIVLGDAYLFKVALFMMLLNWVNSTGEYLLSSAVDARATQLVTSGEIHSARDWIGAFYGNLYTWINGVGIAIQLLLVARIFRRFGVEGAIRVLPALAMLGYAMLAFVPAFAVLRVFKVCENSVNYSLQNTARHALFLPCDEEQKYAGKTTIDTFFWRLGDLAHAGVVFAGVHWLAATPEKFALFNSLIAACWLTLAFSLGRSHRAMIESASPAPATG